MRVLFLYLTAFSRTGGIEKFNRAFMKTAVEVCSEMNMNFKAFSLQDAEGDTRYIDPSLFKGFDSKRINFVFSLLFERLLSDLVILTHINLAPVGVLIKSSRKSARDTYCRWDRCVV